MKDFGEVLLKLDTLFRYLDILVKKPVNGSNNDKIYSVQKSIEKIMKEEMDIEF